MTVIPSPQPKLIFYPPQTVARAERAMRCAPFKLKFLMTMRSTSISLASLAGESGFTNGYTQSPIAELTVERALLWLIQVGILRREVDGQGITDSFRLTPLGRQLLEKYHLEQVIPPPSLADRILNTLSKWFRLW